MPSSYTVDEWRERVLSIRRAALDRSPISGFTHCFYRYPARFSPLFVSAAIRAFSSERGVVVDPFMGGGTTAVEGTVLGRKVIGGDVNELGTFVAQVKTTPLSVSEREAVRKWVDTVVPTLSYRCNRDTLSESLDDRRTRGMQLPHARPIKKLFAQALHTLGDLPSTHASDFIRCALLNVGQWSLNGRRKKTSLDDVRTRLTKVIHEMLESILQYEDAVDLAGGIVPTILNARAGSLPDTSPFSDGLKGDLVVTSPPYPGIHVIYHRWQVDGRRETPAPYWLTASRDGRGCAFYSFADRRDKTFERYFGELQSSYTAVRRILRSGALVVQMVAFSEPRRQLPRYLKAMHEAGFDEIRADVELGARRHSRIWRSVPGRRWHANFKGALPSSREVVLIHRAI